MKNEMPNCPSCESNHAAIDATHLGRGEYYCTESAKGCGQFFTPEAKAPTSLYALPVTKAETYLRQLAGIRGPSPGIPTEAKAEAPAEPELNQMSRSMKETFDKCYGIMRRKSHDYAGHENPYKNFETVTRIGVTVQQGIMMRLLDKITRLENLMASGNAPQVKDETLDDTIEDAINYLAILKARRQYEQSLK